ncbi:glycosyltransferase [Gimesia chilikensis]|uniref:glycosyltransferase n=1 Tax=Gimesia chilikensis TaxID=2605989 RepID=UPI003A932735
MSRIVLTTWGSLGDLHPFLAIALELKSRGHDVIVATCPGYRHQVESLKLGFHPVRPDCDWLNDEAQVRRFSHPRFGLLRVGREILMPALRDSCEDLRAAAQRADLLVTMMACYATRLVAEQEQIPWVSAVHIPLGFYSACDPPVLDVAPFLSRKLHNLGPVFWKSLFGLGKRISRPLARPWYQLRAELGLPPTHEGNPLVDSHSPSLVLALFSRLLADQQADWPPQTVVTGQPVFNSHEKVGLPPALTHFLDQGPPPVVFTLGSAVAANAGSFYEQSIACVQRLGIRAVFIADTGRQKRMPQLTTDMLAVEYAPFDRLFPRAAAVVHHGGVGTTGIAMRAGCPMLVVPIAWDQPDNAERVRRLGIARTLPMHRYTAKTAATALQKLLNDATCVQQAAKVAAQVQQENGTRTACNALEAMLSK